MLTHWSAADEADSAAIALFLTRKATIAEKSQIIIITENNAIFSTYLFVMTIATASRVANWVSMKCL